MKKNDFSPQFPTVWGAGADSAHLQYPIPGSSADLGRASLTLGFPPATFVAPEAGGSFMFGEDMNGALRMLATAAQNYESGVFPPFSASFAQSVGGYPQGCVVADPTSTGVYWVSTADNNLTTPGASGASWVTLSSTVGGRWIGTKRFTVSGTYTPTPGTLFAHVRMVGGGASGYGCKGQSSNSTVSVGAGGNAGTYADVIILNPAACSVVIAGSTANGYNGTSITGGTSSFGSYVSCPGGGAASGADQVTPIWPTGNHSYARPSIASGVIANCLIGDVVGGQGIALALTAGFGGQGANSPFGAGGGQSSPNATGDDAQGYGSGGSGTMSGQNGVALQSGRGAPGYAIVAEWGAI